MVRKIIAMFSPISVFIGMFGIAIVVSAAFPLNIGDVFKGLLLCLPAIITFWFLVKKTHIYSNSLIVGVNEKGFALVDLDYNPTAKDNILDTNREDAQIYEWEDITTAKLDEEECELILKRTNGKEIWIKQGYANWYTLLQKIPKDKLVDDQIPLYLKGYFRLFDTCKICGRIAIEDNKCNHCGADVYSKIIADKHGYTSEEAYIKEEQLAEFEIYEFTEEVRFFDNSKDHYLLDKNWQPIVSEEEVIAYSKKQMEG